MLGKLLFAMKALRLHKGLRQADVLHANSLCEERGDFIIPEAGDAASYAGDVEEEFGMGLSEFDKLVDVRLDGLHPALHGGDGIALALKAYSLTHHGAEPLNGDTGGTASMHASKVAAEDEHFVRLQFRDPVRREGRTRNSIELFFHSQWEMDITWKKRTFKRIVSFVNTLTTRVRNEVHPISG